MIGLETIDLEFPKSLKLLLNSTNNRQNESIDSRRTFLPISRMSTIHQWSDSIGHVLRMGIFGRCDR